jgi:hypothetical protein
LLPAEGGSQTCTPYRRSMLSPTAFRAVAAAQSHFPVHARIVRRLHGGGSGALPRMPSGARVGSLLPGRRLLWPQQQRQQRGLAAPAAPSSEKELEFSHDKTTVLFGVRDKPGALSEALNLFGEHDMDMTHISSRPSKQDMQGFEFEIDFKGDEFDPAVSAFLSSLRERTRHLRVLGKRQVPWFPRHISDFDHFTQKTLDAGEDLESDHPGFNDDEYRARRQAITEQAKAYKAGTGRVPNPISPVSQPFHLESVPC